MAKDTSKKVISLFLIFFLVVIGILWSFRSILSKFSYSQIKSVNTVTKATSVKFPAKTTLLSSSYSKQMNEVLEAKILLPKIYLKQFISQEIFKGEHFNNKHSDILEYKISFTPESKAWNLKTMRNFLALDTS